MSKLPYRPNVGIVLFNRDGLVLVGERLDNLGAWQYPQGGVDEGEDFPAAANRELYEEVGVHVDFLTQTEEFLYYEFPPDLRIKHLTDTYRGQKQKWFLGYWDNPPETANLKTHTQEFARVLFKPMAEVTNQIVEFKKQIYLELERVFLPLIYDHIRTSKTRE